MMNLNERSTFILKMKYHQCVGIWENFCRLHSDLFEKACDEYVTLLASDIDKLELILATKENIIQDIKTIEAERRELIDDLRHNGLSITRASELLSAMQSLPEEKEKKFLARYNLLLIDIIERIQEQNKKNQMFLNKAILSLKEIRESFNGNKTYTTYNSMGAAQSRARI